MNSPSSGWCLSQTARSNSHCKPRPTIASNRKLPSPSRMLLTLLPDELAEYSAVPAKWRMRADVWNSVLGQLSSGQLTKPEAMNLLKCSLATLNRKITDVQTQGWRALVPNYKAPVSLPNDFVDYWKTLQESYQRKTRPAMRELYRRWRDRHPIPGYAGHVGWPNLPRGWDERNLYRYQPTKLELTALRHGLGRAISLHAPKVLSTRVGLRHLQYVVYDDVKFDTSTHLLTSNKLLCALQLGGLDLLSTCRFVHGTKPQLIRADGTKEGLKEADMRFILANQLYNFGINGVTGTTFVIEHGTATIRDRVRDILIRGLGGKIQFSESGMTGKMQAIAGMGDGKGGGGNFRHKAALESLHGYIHNEASHLLGQTGHDRDAPEFLGVLQREHEFLWKLARGLPPEVLHNLQFPVLEYHTQFLPVMTAILERINQRDDHELEGWEECKFLTRDYRIMADSAEWINERRLMTLEQPVRQALLAMAQADRRCLNVRKLSPREVFQAGAASGEVMQVPHSLIAEILYEDAAVPRICQDSSFTFEDQTLAPGKLVYESRITRPDGREVELRDRETYETVLNPFDPSVLWVFSGRQKQGSFLGVAKRDVRACRADAEASQRKFARSKQRLSDQLTDSRRRNTSRTDAATARNRHNLGVITQYRADQTALTEAAEDALDGTTPFDSSTLTPSNHEHDDDNLW